jgi:hypothetical protein
MNEEIYEKHLRFKIQSTPRKAPKNDPYKYRINGVIEFIKNGIINHITTDKLSIPDEEWNHHTEQSADNVFIKYAKKYIDENSM